MDSISFNNYRQTPFLVFVIFALGSTSSIAEETADFTGSWQTGWGPVTIVQTNTHASGSYTGVFSG